jgi:hypothetical protein
MRRTTLLVTFAFLAGLGIGYVARSAGLRVPHKPDPPRRGLGGIEKLHKADVAATLTQDPASPN